jgi:L-ascorbate metabolism protein UlaG (beta-lactamase superfamily)
VPVGRARRPGGSGRLWGMMRLTKFSHSCVRLERDGAVLVIDPGGFSERAALDGVDAVLITHEHPDHLNPDAVADALAKRPDARIYCNESVAGQLGALGDAVTVVESGQEFSAAGFEVRAYGAWHAVIHPDLPPVANLGFLVERRVYHPGDSFDVPEGSSIDTVFVPVTAPWLKASEAIEFLRTVKPRRAYALHDALGNELIFGLLDNLLNNLSGAEYRRLEPGETIDA